MNKYPIYFCGDLIEETRFSTTDSTLNKRYIGAAGNILENFLTLPPLSFLEDPVLVSPFLIKNFDPGYIVQYLGASSVIEARDYTNDEWEMQVSKKQRLVLSEDLALIYALQNLSFKEGIYVVEQHFLDQRHLCYLFQKTLNHLQNSLIFFDIRDKDFFERNKDEINFDLFKNNRVVIKHNEHCLFDSNFEDHSFSEVITYEDGHAVFRSPDQFVYAIVPPFKIPTKNTIGCGDSFYASFIYTYLLSIQSSLTESVENYLIHRSLLNGLVAGTYSATKPYICHTNYIEGFLALNEGN